MIFDTVPVPADAVAAPVAIRLVGTLDRALVEDFCDACAGLGIAGKRTFFVLVRDLHVVRDTGVNRLFAALSASRRAGNRMFVQTDAAWRRLAALHGVDFSEIADGDMQFARRQIIICHSVDRRRKSERPRS